MAAPRDSYSYPFEIANTSKFSTALASLSDNLNLHFNKINNDAPTSDIPFMNLYNLVLLFQATHRVCITLLFAHGQATSCSSLPLLPQNEVLRSTYGIWLPLPAPNEILRFSPLGIDTFIRCLTKVDIEELPQDAKECDICKVEYSAFDGPQMGTGVSSTCTPSTNQKVIDGEQVMESPVKFRCGHIFGENCLRSIIKEAMNGVRWPTCPMCRAALDGIRDLEVPFEAEVIITLDGLRGLTKWLDPWAPERITLQALPVLLQEGNTARSCRGRRQIRKLRILDSNIVNGFGNY